ncbi:DUF202 domain-containing protein [Pseudoxanthomonas sp. NC8]|nr:DUF202 domain-containing protein [Pseudoxanthomonas sp. NC8]
MAFQRTRLAADRTLMAVIRTSLSLISFGFTIHKVFEGLKESGAIAHAASARNFGVSLVLLGVVMLLIGIGYHAWFMRALRKQRRDMAEDRLIHGEGPFPPSMTLVTAILLLVPGAVAIANMTLHLGAVRLNRRGNRPRCCGAEAGRVRRAPRRDAGGSHGPGTGALRSNVARRGPGSTWRTTLAQSAPLGSRHVPIDLSQCDARRIPAGRTRRRHGGVGRRGRRLGLDGRALPVGGEHRHRPADHRSADRSRKRVVLLRAGRCVHGAGRRPQRAVGRLRRFHLPGPVGQHGTALRAHRERHRCTPARRGALPWASGERDRGLDLFGGVRYIDLDLNVRFEPNNPARPPSSLDAGARYLDLLLGARYTWALNERWGLGPARRRFCGRDRRHLERVGDGQLPHRQRRLAVRLPLSRRQAGQRQRRRDPGPQRPRGGLRLPLLTLARGCMPGTAHDSFPAIPTSRGDEDADPFQAGASDAGAGAAGAVAGSGVRRAGHPVEQVARAAGWQRQRRWRGRAVVHAQGRYRQQRGRGHSQGHPREPRRAVGARRDQEGLRQERVQGRDRRRRGRAGQEARQHTGLRDRGRAQHRRGPAREPRPRVSSRAPGRARRRARPWRRWMRLQRFA